MAFDYQTICYKVLLKGLAERTGDIISRRFGISRPGQVEREKETLEMAGRAYDITRERVRQIEEDGLRRLREKAADPDCQNIFQYFIEELKTNGGLEKEDILLNRLGGAKFKNHVFFLLTLGKPFKRFGETKDFYAFWTIDKDSFKRAQKVINSFKVELKKKKEPLLLPLQGLASYIEISKEILKGSEGLYGLRDWPVIRPRGIKDKAYIVFKKEKKPLHFTKVASLINSLPGLPTPKPAIFQTVHNELIKDSRFVLIGRGLYALQEWGFEPGVVREVIARILDKARKPLEQEEVLKEALKQRQVKPNTILLNLQNKKYFIKNSDGKYTIRKA